MYTLPFGACTEKKTRASAQRVTNTPGRRHFLIMNYFKVNDNDIRQDTAYNVKTLSDTDLSSQVQLSWSKQSLRHEANSLGYKI